MATAPKAASLAEKTVGIWAGVALLNPFQGEWREY